MTGFVYAIGDSARVKIGWSGNPEARFVKIATDCPDRVELLGTVPATVAQEQELHSLFDRWRISGEWFRREGPVETFISMLRKPAPKPVIQVNAMTRIRKEVFHATQAEMAEIAGTAQASISRWENEETSPTLLDLAKIRSEAMTRGLDWDDSWFFEAPAEAAQ